MTLYTADYAAYDEATIQFTITATAAGANPPSSASDTFNIYFIDKCRTGETLTAAASASD